MMIKSIPNCQMLGKNANFYNLLTFSYLKAMNLMVWTKIVKVDDTKTSSHVEKSKLKKNARDYPFEINKIAETNISVKLR